MPEPVAEALRETVIAPGRGGIFAGLREAMERREVLFFLAARDISARYQQTFFGMAWAFMEPLANMVIFTMVFHRIGKVEAGSLPYPLFCFAGLLIWQLFQTSMQQTSISIVKEKGLISKVYFPRILVPLSAISVALVDFCVASLLLAGLSIYYGVEPTWRLALLPAVVAGAGLAALSFGVWLTAINARFRDVQVVVPFVLRIWIFLSPVAYPSKTILEQLPESWRWAYYLNPMASVVDGFRWAVLGEDCVSLSGMGLSCCVSGLLLIFGYAYFRRAERTIVDLL